jgi:hypothetical protein
MLPLTMAVTVVADGVVPQGVPVEGDLVGVEWAAWKWSHT